MRTAALCSCIALLVAAASTAHAERVHRHQLDAARARGLEIVQDYGAVLWMQTPRRAGDAPRAEYLVELGGRRFDPAFSAEAALRSYGDASALRLMQFDAPIRPQWLEALKQAGVQPLQAIEPFAYVVWAPSAALQAVSRGAAAQSLRFAGDFLPAYKTAALAEGIKRGEREWMLMAVRLAALDASTLEASGIELLERAPLDANFELLRVRLRSPANAQSLAAAAQLPAVYALQPARRDGGLRGELQQQLSANNLGSNGLPVPGYLDWLQGLGLSGAGVTIANVDGGIFDQHPDLVARMISCVGDTCGGSATDAHGTHTAAIMAGDGSSGVVDGNGFLRGLGMAPGAQLVEQVYSPHFQQAGGMLKLMRQSHANGAALSGNSWGPAGKPQGYDLDTRQVDVGSRDVDPDAPGDQALTYVLSIMNGYGGTSSQGSPDEAKNVITVGSTRAQFSNQAPDPAFNDLSANSAHGPALDGRRIPHLVAPGCRVDSAISATGFGTNCGTSMASPQVSGAVALFIEQYRAAHDGRDPSPALAKAALVASTQDLAGRRDADGGTLGPRPDSKQGWGRLRADRLLAPGVPVLLFDAPVEGLIAGAGDSAIFDSTGEAWARGVVAADPQQPMLLVLAWTDAPGHGLGGSTPAWNNDLDLLARSGGASYFGNVLGADGFSQPGGSADPRNNIEVVVLPGALAAGGVEIGVIAASLSADALPNRAGLTDQDFALVCVNCIAQPLFRLSADPSQLDACGLGMLEVGIELDALPGYSGEVSLSAQTPTGIGASFSPATLTVPGSSRLTLDLLAPLEGTQQVRVQASDSRLQEELALALNYSAELPAAAALQWPSDGEMDVGLSPQLRWRADGAQRTRLEIAADPGFDTLLLDIELGAEHFQAQGLLQPDREYWWRLTPINACGEGARAPARRFRTAVATCSIHDASDLPLALGPNAATISESRVDLDRPGRVASVSLPQIAGQHGHFGDLGAQLVAPDGRIANLWQRLCGDSEDFEFGLDDDAAHAIGEITCPPAGGAAYRPAESFSSLTGGLAAGAWTLRITDHASGDGGSLESWQLRVCSVDGREDSGNVFADGFEATRR
jgi:serine protease AprX